MTSTRYTSRTRRTAVNSALVAAMLAGCAGIGHLAIANAATSQAESGKAGKVVANAEKAVTRNPQDASLRLALGHAYLSAGRFESAVDAFNDAAQLGEASGATALALSLAQVGSGQSGAAVETLNLYRDRIPASDLGLALALAGETSRGTAILSDALRGGENTVKLRQNLAYAYALDGRWSEARVMASQDVPADKIDARISDWAMRGKPEDYRLRVSGLLNVPLRADSGEPAHLALAPRAGGEQLASASEVQAASANGELAALDGSTVPASQTPVQSAYIDTPSAAEPVPAQTAPAEPDAPAQFGTAFAQADPAPQPTFISEPVIQAIPVRAAEPQQARSAPRRTSAAYAVPARAAAGGGSHHVQLGAFSSEARARQGWNIFVSRNPVLRSYKLAISQAVVRGQNFWRVAAAGLDSRGASGLCSSVKGRGGACFAYAVNRPPMGAVPGSQQGSAGVMKARRR